MGVTGCRVCYLSMSRDGLHRPCIGLITCTLRTGRHCFGGCPIGTPLLGGGQAKLVGRYRVQRPALAVRCAGQIQQSVEPVPALSPFAVLLRLLVGASTLGGRTCALSLLRAPSAYPDDMLAAPCLNRAVLLRPLWCPGPPARSAPSRVCRLSGVWSGNPDLIPDTSTLVPVCQGGI